MELSRDGHYHVEYVGNALRVECALKPGVKNRVILRSQDLMISTWRSSLLRL